MATPALRALKLANPASRLRFYTNFPDLVRELPYIDEVLPYAARPPGCVFIEYTDIVPSRAHIARLMGDRIGVAVTDTTPDCVIDQTLVDFYRRAWRDLPRPIVAIVRRASRFTPNKDWPQRSWEELAERIARVGTSGEVAYREKIDPPTPPGTYVDLRGRTSIKELVAVMAAADIYVGPVSGPMHIAAAAGTPAVVIIGGYEHKDNAHYAGNVEFYTPVACAPCWLRDPCPFGLKCLTVISSDQVWRAVEAMWGRLQEAATA